MVTKVPKCLMHSKDGQIPNQVPLELDGHNPIAGQRRCPCDFILEICQPLELSWEPERGCTLSFSPQLQQRWGTCRFREGKKLSAEETEAFAQYFYHITAQRGSGEHALSHLLGPMAWARHPLEGRMHQLQASMQGLVAAVGPSKAHKSCSMTPHN